MSNIYKRLLSAGFHVDEHVNDNSTVLPTNKNVNKNNINNNFI